jgi:hypothetical protein
VALVGARLFASVMLLCAGLCGARSEARSSGAYAQMTEAQVSAAIARDHAVEPLGARIQAVSEPFLGTPYVLGNMGEGPEGDGRDTDPRYNVLSADCTTFVEHAMAFALARDLPEAKVLLDRIRYLHGQVGYGQRRHWPEAQWVHGLEEEGFLEDATAQVAGADARVEQASVSIDPKLLRESAHEELKRKLRPDEVPSGTFTVPYVPLDRVLAVQQRLQPGMVLNVVKAPRADLLVRISHQGLVVQKGGVFYVRNASSIGKKAVVDEPLSEFVSRQRRTLSWPTVGFNFLRVRPLPASDAR